MRHKVAVTGASGFIGRHVVRALLDLDVDITAISRDPTLFSGLSDQLMVVQLDLSAPGDKIFDRLGRPDVLLHLAWGGLPNYRSLYHFENELPRHYVFLRDLVAGGLTSILVTGTCFEYGMQSGPLDETLICRPSTPYGFSKDVLHRELQFLQAGRPFNLVWARLFYLFGEGQAESSLWSQLNRAVAAGERHFKMSGGEQLRDFLPVAEVAGYLVQLALTQQELGPVNVCSGRPQSVRNLVQSWIRQYGWEIEPSLGCYPYPDYEPMAFWGTRQKLDSILVLS